jgi:hypothetical protein
VTTLFYPEDHQPQLPHEYQFNLDTADGQKALQSMLAFLRERTASQNLASQVPTTIDASRLLSPFTGLVSR